jgi:hypothetical protein
LWHAWHPAPETLLQIFAAGYAPLFAVPVFQTVVGLALILGAKGLSRWWFRLRNGTGSS